MFFLFCFLYIFIDESIKNLNVRGLPGDAVPNEAMRDAVPSASEGCLAIALFFVTPSVSFVTPSASEGSHGAYAPREDKKKSVPREDKKGRRASGRQKEKRAWEDKKSRVLDETASTHLAKI